MTSLTLPLNSHKVLRRKLAPAPIPFGDESDSASDDGGDSDCGGAAAAYPEYATMQNISQGLEHTSSTPANGKYGDPAVDRLWRSYVEDGKRGEEVDEALKLMGRGTTAKAKKKPMADPAKPASGPAQPKAPPPVNLSDQGRYETKAPGAEGNVQTPIKRVQFVLDGECGELVLSQEHWKRYWREDEAGLPRLRDAEDCGRSVLFPIFCPSSGRPQTARIDLQEAMQGEAYVQLVCVKHKEIESYLKFNPSLDFFVLPPSADERGIGASRMWIVRMARLVCTEACAQPTAAPVCHGQGHAPLASSPALSLLLRVNMRSGSASSSCWTTTCKRGRRWGWVSRTAHLRRCPTSSSARRVGRRARRRTSHSAR